MQTITLYRAILAAAATAPTASEAKAMQYARINAQAVASKATTAAAEYWESAETGCERVHMELREQLEASGEMLELACRSMAPRHLTFRHASGHIKLLNISERLQGFAADMLRGGNWALWGGGEKPAEASRKKSQRTPWRATLVKVTGEAMEDGHAGEFLAAALEQLGGQAYMHQQGKPFILYAPEFSDALPDGFAVARRCDGRWICTHMASGFSVGTAERVKARALESGANAITAAGPEKTEQALARIRQTQQDHAAALQAWREMHKLQDEATEQPATQAAPEVETEATESEQASTDTDTDTPAPAATATISTYAPPACGSAHKDWTGHESAEFLPDARQQVVIASVKKALSSGAFYNKDVLNLVTADLSPSEAILSAGVGRVEGGDFGMDVYYARRHIEARQRLNTDRATAASLSLSAGDKIGTVRASDFKRITGLTVVSVSEDGLTFVTNGKRGAHSVKWTVSISSLKAAIERAHEKGLRRDSFTEFLATRKAAAEKLAAQPATEPAAILAASLAIAAAQASSAADALAPAADENTDETAGELVTCDGPEQEGEAVAGVDTPATPADAVGQADTPASTEAGDYTDPLKTQAQASDYTSPLKTQATAWRADLVAARSASNTQHASSKSGTWRAEMFRTSDGRAGLVFVGADGSEQFSEHASGSDRMRALQAMARAAEQANQHQHRAGDYSNPLKTPEQPTDCTEAHETPGAAGSLSICLERHEGLSEEFGKPETVHSFAEADALLTRWSESAPENGGYDKCGFVVTWPDGSIYQGRFDLVHHRRERPSLRDHIAGEAEFWLGQFCPMHMGEQEYKNSISRATEENLAWWTSVLNLLRTHAAYFPRTNPISCPDLVLLIEHININAADLVGLGVTNYNPSEPSHLSTKQGAITQISTAEGRGEKWITGRVTYEDGTHEDINRESFRDHDSSRRIRRRLNLQRHGAPYLAQLAAAEAARKAANSSAAERKAQAAQKARTDMLAEFAHLERGAGCVVAARNMRTMLKTTFPNVKFSVKCRQYSGGNSIDVTWTDGPTEKAVRAIIGRFKNGSFNGMDDSYEFSQSPFTELFGGCYYLDAGRKESPELIAKALEQHFPNAENRPSVEDWTHQRGALDWRSDADSVRAEFRRHLSSIDATPPAKTRKSKA